MPLADELKSSEVGGNVHPWRRANFGRPDGKNPLAEATLDSHSFQNLGFRIAFGISFSYRMLFLESFGNCTELTQRLRVKSVHVLSLVLVIKHSDELACFHLLLSLQNCATCRRLVLLCVSKVPVRCETQWQSCFLHSHSTVSRVVVETTWEGAEHNTGLERTKPHVFCQDKWPAGSYTTRVASGRGFLLLILLYSIPSLPPNSPLYLY